MSVSKTSDKELNKRKEKRKTIQSIKLMEAMTTDGEFKCICGASYNDKQILTRHKSLCEYWKCEDGYKICRKCFKKQHIDNFYKSKHSSDGLYFKCKSCENERKENAEKSNPGISRIKSKDRYRDGGWLRTLEWREKNREKLREKNNERAKKRKHKLGISHNLSILEEKIRRDSVIHATILKLGGKCTMCGETEPEFLTIDHILGGGNTEASKRGHLGWKRDILNGLTDASIYRVLCHNCNSGSYRKNVNDVGFGVTIEMGVTKVCSVCNSEKDKSMFPVRGTICKLCSRKQGMKVITSIHKLMGNVYVAEKWTHIN
jgi:hypothetical protein